MNKLTNLYRTLLALSVAVIGVAYGQDGTVRIDPLKSFPLPKPVVIDTRLQVPQIAPIQIRAKVSENELLVHQIKQGIPNNLPVGGMLNESHGSLPKLQFDGPGFTNGWPPDCDMAVGPKHVVCVVNEAMAIYDKTTGKKQFQTNLTGDQFFSGLGVVGEVISDPKIQYDAGSGHWFVHIIEVDGLSSGTHGSYQLVGVSETSDPNGKWKKYRINSLITSGSNDYWLDYPGVGISGDGFVITGNMFGFTSGFMGGIFATSKTALINGTAGTVTVFTDDQASTIEPARYYNANAQYVYMMSTYSTSSLKIFAVNNFASTPKLVSSIVQVPQFTPSTRDANGPNGHQMDGFDPRMFTAVMRNTSLYGAHNCMSPDGRVLACRWYEVGLQNWPLGSKQPALVQSGNIFDPSGVVDSHMPAINVNKYSNISVMYTRSSPNLEATLAYSAHKKTDAAGTMGAPITLGSSKANSGAQPANRWGDFFNVSIDPTDDRTFWGFGELCVANGLWTTQVNSWSVTDPSLAKAYAPSPANVFEGKLVSGTAAALAKKDGMVMVIKSAKAATTNDQFASVEGIYKTDLVSGSVDLLTVTPVATVPSAVTMQVYAWDWTANKYVVIASVPATNTSDITIATGAANTARFIDQGGNVKILFRAVYPARLNAVPFNFTIDQLQLNGLPS